MTLLAEWICRTGAWRRRRADRVAGRRTRRERGGRRAGRESGRRAGDRAGSSVGEPARVPRLQVDPARGFPDRLAAEVQAQGLQAGDEGLLLGGDLSGAGGRWRGVGLCG